MLESPTSKDPHLTRLLENKTKQKRVQQTKTRKQQTTNFTGDAWVLLSTLHSLKTNKRTKIGKFCFIIIRVAYL